MPVGWYSVRSVWPPGFRVKKLIFNKLTNIPSGDFEIVCRVPSAVRLGAVQNAVVWCGTVYQDR